MQAHVIDIDSLLDSAVFAQLVHQSIDMSSNNWNLLRQGRFAERMGELLSRRGMPDRISFSS